MTKPLILVVEDDLALLEGIRELLELTEYKVITAMNGQEALDVLEKQRPDLIVSDIMMPEMDGYEFHEKVSEQPQLNAIPFIFLTARGEKADIRRGKDIGVDDYITKPFDDEDLLVGVRAKLSRWDGLRKQRDEEVSDLKSKILLTLSHEFRTPLTYIINYSDLLAEVGPAHYKRVDLRLARPIVKEHMVKQLAEDAPSSIGGVEISTINTMDGVKYLLADDSWLLIRPSGTEPVLRVYAEARDPEQVSRLLEFGQSVAEGT